MKLIVSNLNFSYGDKIIIKDLSFEVADYSVLSLVGSSGAGKTTVFSILAGFINLSSGKIFLDDIDITNIKPEKRPVVTMFQDGGLFPHLSVLNNVKFGLTSKFNKNRFKHIDINKYSMDLIEKVGLKGMESRYPHELSGGQKQRVSLARSIAVKPRLLLLDEPFSALDPVLKYQLNILVDKIVKEEGIIAIKITHDLNDALISSSQIMLIQDTICYNSSPTEIREGRANLQLLKYFKFACQINENQLVLSKNLSPQIKCNSIQFSVVSVRSVGHMFEYLLLNGSSAITYISSEKFSGGVILYYDPDSIIEVNF